MPRSLLVKVVSLNFPIDWMWFVQTMWKSPSLIQKVLAVLVELLIDLSEKFSPLRPTQASNDIMLTRICLPVSWFVRESTNLIQRFYHSCCCYCRCYNLLSCSLFIYRSIYINMDKTMSPLCSIPCIFPNTSWPASIRRSHGYRLRVFYDASLSRLNIPLDWNSAMSSESAISVIETVRKKLEKYIELKQYNKVSDNSRST